MPNLRTARFVLEPCPRELLEAACARARRGDLPADWPDFEALPLFEAHAALVHAEPAALPWGPWTVREGDELVGDVGCKGPPDEDGTIELSYFVRRQHRGRGIAVEALSAFLAWAGEHGAKRFRAEVHRDNARSIGVLRALGFSLADVADEELWFERSTGFG